MNYSEITDVVSEIAQAWPVYSPAERKDLLVKKLEDLDYRKAKQGIDDLIMSFKGIPNIADMVEAIKNAKVEIVIANCNICFNEGWILVNEQGHGTYKQCSCGNQGRSRLADQRDRTSEGKLIASFDESCWALYKGMRDYVDENVDRGMSDEEICNTLSTTFPQRAERLKVLIEERSQLQDIF